MELMDFKREYSNYTKNSIYPSRLFFKIKLLTYGVYPDYAEKEMDKLQQLYSHFNENKCLETFEELMKQCNAFEFFQQYYEKIQAKMS